MATLTTAPPEVALSGDGIYVQLGTALISSDASMFEIEITGSGPSDTQKLTLAWPGGDVTYTADTDADGSPELWPLKAGGESLQDYADRIADFLRDGGLITAIFNVVRAGAGGSGELIQLVHVVSGEFDLSVTTNTMSGVTVTPTNSAEPATPPNLRAVVQVLADNGDDDAYIDLLTQHAPFQSPDAVAVLDIHAAFAYLSPHMPTEASIVLPTAASPSWYFEDAPEGIQKYFIRYGERWGTPALLGRLTRDTGRYHAIAGAHSGAALLPAQVSDFCHDYNRRDGARFRKPVSDIQCDWGYWFTRTLEEDTPLTVITKLYWSDGEESTYTPFSSGLPTASPQKMYVFATGYRQLRLYLPTPPVDPESFIVAYDVQLYAQADLDNPLLTIYYSVSPQYPAWNMYLLFENGVGGIESTWLRGKATQRYDVKAAEYQVPRWYQQRPALTGDFLQYEQQGRDAWEVSTGWYDDPYYLEHLRQLPLSRCWIIDMQAGRFLSCIVEGTESAVRQDDETLYELTFKIRSGWYDDAANI